MNTSFLNSQSRVKFEMMRKLSRMFKVDPLSQRCKQLNCYININSFLQNRVTRKRS